MYHDHYLHALKAERHGEGVFSKFLMSLTLCVSYHTVDLDTCANRGTEIWRMRLAVENVQISRNVTILEENGWTGAASITFSNVGGSKNGLRNIFCRDYFQEKG